MDKLDNQNLLSTDSPTDVVSEAYPTPLCPTCYKREKRRQCVLLWNHRKKRLLPELLQVLERRVRSNSDLLHVSTIVKPLSRTLDMTVEQTAKMISDVMQAINAVESDYTIDSRSRLFMDKFYSIDAGTVVRLRAFTDHFIQSYDSEAGCIRLTPHSGRALRSHSSTSEDYPTTETPSTVQEEPLPAPVPTQVLESSEQRDAPTSQMPSAVPRAGSPFSDIPSALLRPVSFYVFEKHVQIVDRLLNVTGELISQVNQVEDRLKTIERKVSELQIMLSNQGADR